MLKYIDAVVTFAEVPDQVNLCISISGCPNHCPACHSKYLWDDIGTPLTIAELDSLLEKNKGVTCVCFMGGDGSPTEVLELATHLHLDTPLKTCWYTGKTREYWESTDLFPGNYEVLDYIKFGPYDEKYGSLDKPTTNQRFYKRVFLNNGKEVWDGGIGLEDITHLFWRK